MNLVRHTLLLLLAIVSLTQAVSQTIVNTETLLLDADEAFQWTTGLAGDFSHGNSNVIDLSMDAGAAWTQGKWAIKAAGAWARLAEDGNDIQANAFGQIRVTVGEVGIVQPYAFAQVSRNNVLLLNQRNLAGLGIKRRLLDTESLFLETSLGAFWELESYTNESGEVPKELLRNSLIVSMAWQELDDVQLRMTAYVQSAYSDWTDSRVFLECSVNVALSSNIAMEWNAGFRWDGDPHGGLGSWDLGNTVGLRLGLSDD